MRVFFGGLFVFSIFNSLELSASGSGVDSKTGNSTLWGSSQNSSSGGSGGSYPSPQDSRPTTNATSSVDDLLKELERKLSDLRTKLKQMTVQLTAEWDREAMLQMNVAADQSLHDLKQLSLRELPLPIRDKVEKMEQSVENIKTTVYLLVQARDLDHHNFTGKIGNNQVSLEHLKKWMDDFSSQLLNLERTRQISRENSAKLSNDVTFELKQIFIFVERIGWEHISVELQTQLNKLQERVNVFVIRLLTIDESKTGTVFDVQSFERLISKIRSLTIDFIFYESNAHENHSKLLQEMKIKLAVIMSEVRKPNVPEFLVQAAEKLKNRILIAENSKISPDNTKNSTSKYAEYEDRFSKFEKALDDMFRKLSLTSSVPTLVKSGEKVSRILAEVNELLRHKISIAVKIRLLLIQQKATKCKQLIISIMAFNQRPQTAGIDMRSIDNNMKSNKNFEEKLNLLQRQYEQLKNIFRYKQNINVLLAIKYQTENIIIHLNYLGGLPTITPLQRRISEYILEEIEFFLNRIKAAIVRETKRGPQYDDGGKTSGPEKETVTGKPEETDDRKFDNLGNRSQEASIHLNYPLDTSLLQELREIILVMIKDLQIIKGGKITADQLEEIRRLEQTGKDFALLIPSSTPGRTGETATITDENDDFQYILLQRWEEFSKELLKQTNAITSSSRNSEYASFLIRTLEQLQKEIRETQRNDSTVTGNGTETIDRNALLQAARVDSLQSYFIHLIDTICFNEGSSNYDEYRTQIEGMIRELQRLKRSNETSQELKIKIGYLEQDLKKFKIHLEFMLNTERDGITNHYKRDYENAEFTETMTRSIQRELEVLRSRFSKEQSLSQMYQINVQVHRILLKVEMMRWEVPIHLRGETDQLQQLIKVLVRDVGLKIKQIREHRASLEQEKFDSIFQNVSYTVRGILMKIKRFQDVLAKLEMHSKQDALDQSVLSRTFYQLENLVLKLRKLQLWSASDSSSVFKLLIHRVRSVQDKITGATIKTGAEQTSESVETSESLSVNHRINEIYQHLYYLSGEVFHSHDRLSLMQISLELHHLLIDLTNLKTLGLPRQLQKHVDHLFNKGMNLDRKILYASVGQIHALRFTLRKRYIKNYDLNERSIKF